MLTLRGFPLAYRPAVITLATVSLLALAVRPGSGPTEPTWPASVVVNSGVLALSVPERVAAGESFVVEVEGATPGRMLTATVDAGYGLRHVSVTPESSTVALTIPEFTGPASGEALVSVVQDRRLGIATIEIEPGPPVGPIDVYLGPRTVIADREHFVMVVAVPEDQFGNPVADGTAVDFTTTRPDQTVEAAQELTADLLAWSEIFSGAVAGRTRVATRSAGASAPERTFLEVADLPAPYSLELIDPMLPADGHALLTIATEPLTDQYGNVLPDGTVVYLDAAGVTGIRRIHGQTVDGRAKFTLEVPDRSGDVSLTATASGVRSEPLTLSFTSAVVSFAAEYWRGQDEVLVRVGPVRSVRESFVPEGTLARVTSPDGSVALAELVLGVGVARLPADVDLSRLSVEVLGSKTVARAAP